MLAFSGSCPLNQQSISQSFRATLNGNTLGEFVIQVSNRRFVSKAQIQKCDHISILCASQCSCRASVTRAQSVQPVSVHVCFVSAADSQAGYKWGGSYHATQAMLVERERWSASQFCPTHHPGCFGWFAVAWDGFVFPFGGA